jgi:hypothetical protein
MKPIFTVHAGEFLVGEHIERKFRRVHVWVPSQDMGTDLLVTDRDNTKAVSLQVKFSRDFLVTHMPAEFQKPMRACGWWSLNREKIQSSRADYWVFVLVGCDRRSRDFVIIKPGELLRRLDSIHGRVSRIQSYLWITEAGRCWETRGLNRREQRQIAQGDFQHRNRDFTKLLNNWAPIEALT